MKATVLTSAVCVWVAVQAVAAPTHLVLRSPVRITEVAEGVFLVDFGRVAFGNLQLTAPPGVKGKVAVHFGEKLLNGRVDRHPPGTVRYAKTEVVLNGQQPVIAAPPPDPRNTEQHSDRHPPAILTPPEWGVVLPFRWVELERWPGELRPDFVRQRAAFSATWDDDAASFRCSDEMLNRIWELCRYSIKATTFAGIYVDGDRERIPYEADAYLTQLSHYATDNDVRMARDTFDWLMKHPTWPTEWAPHMVFMAYADWMHTGDRNWLAERYDSLRSKLLLDRAGPDGLIRSGPEQIKRGDIVDWPKGERDGFVFTSLNTVVNAFHLRALKLMAEMGAAIGRRDRAAEYAAREKRVRAVFQDTFFDRQRRLYKDGKDTDHVSLHANLFPLAFELVPEQYRPGVVRWLAKRGMRCSVYAAQYLLEGLFKYGADADAVRLMTAPGDRSWRHMVESGATITWEAWDLKYKPNMDWNHAWGAAPANLLPRFVLGAQPASPGWRQAKISPRPGTLRYAEGKVPTPRGPISIRWKRTPTFTLWMTLPKGVSARVDLPATKQECRIFVNGTPVNTHQEENRWVIDTPVTATAKIEVR